MNVKKEAVESIKNHLYEKQRRLRFDLVRQKRDMEEIVRAQTRIKREIAKYGELINLL